MQVPETWDDPRARRNRTWMYTINNYTEEDIERLSALECSYNVFGKEIAPTTGTPHLQGCITFNTTHRFKQAARVLKGNLTIPKVVDQARNYCMKDNDFIIIDRRTRQGKRNDLVELTEYVKKGHTLKETAMEFSSTYVKYHAGILQLTRHMQQDTPRCTKPVVHWYFGGTGLGKTRSVFEAEPELWITSDSLTYFNGYANQRAVVFDDFRGGFCKFRELLRLLDRYPMVVNIKYGTANWNPDRIYITSNKPPELCYEKPDEDMQQLVRRIDNIVEFQSRPLFGPFGDNGDLFAPIDPGPIHNIIKGTFSPGP